MENPEYPGVECGYQYCDNSTKDSCWSCDWHNKYVVGLIHEEIKKEPPKRAFKKAIFAIIPKSFSNLCIRLNESL